MSNCSAISWQEQVIFRVELFCYIMVRTSYMSWAIVLLYHGKNKLYFVRNCSAISWQEQVIFRAQLFCYIMARLTRVPIEDLGFLPRVWEKTLNFSYEWKKSPIFNKDECKYLFLPFQLKNKACRFRSFIRMSMSCLLHKILQRHVQCSKYTFI